MNRLTTLIVAVVGGLVLVPGSAFALNESEALTMVLSHRPATAGGLQISSSGQSTFERADAVLSGEETGLPPARRSEPAYPFVLVSTTGEQFHGLSSPPGRVPPSEPYESVIVSVGWTATTLSPRPPLIQRLGTVVTLNLASGSGTASSTSCRVDELLTSALKHKHLHARAAGAAPALKTCEARHG
jgi:hypothetical protein